MLRVPFESAPCERCHSSLLAMGPYSQSPRKVYTPVGRLTLYLLTTLSIRVRKSYMDTVNKGPCSGTRTLRPISMQCYCESTTALSSISVISAAGVPATRATAPEYSSEAMLRGLAPLYERWSVENVSLYRICSSAGPPCPLAALGLGGKWRSTKPGFSLKGLLCRFFYKFYVNLHYKIAGSSESNELQNRCCADSTYFLL
jgi:hypothetical protein